MPAGTQPTTGARACYVSISMVKKTMTALVTKNVPSFEEPQFQQRAGNRAVLGARFTLLAQILCPNVAPCSACRWTGHAATGFHVGPWYLDEGDVVGPKYLQMPATVEPQKMKAKTLTLPVEAEFHYVGQTGLELLTSSDLPISASQSAGITDVSHQHAGQYIYITILFENYHFGRLRQADHWRSGVQEQPGQHGETVSTKKYKKKKKFAGLIYQLLRRLRQEILLNPGRGGGRPCKNVSQVLKFRKVCLDGCWFAKSCSSSVVERAETLLEEQCLSYAVIIPTTNNALDIPHKTEAQKRAKRNEKEWPYASKGAKQMGIGSKN
ncbi:Protein GVQW1 [Plecturocebus cupreus]